MTTIPLPFSRNESDRVIAGVCAGIANELDVDPTLVRLVFAVLALAGGAGIVLYLALWAWVAGRRPILVITLAAFATMALLLALGFSPAIIAGLGLMLSGGILLLRAGTRSRIPGIALAMAGAVIVLQHLGNHSGAVVAPGALAGALLLLLGPWAWRLTRERSERIRLAERAEIAARVHDSVLQTLALVQRDADDPARVRALARRQERELRRWLYGSGYGDATTLADALAEAAADVEEAHGVRVELAASGDVPFDDALSPLALAAREALTNAAKHSGADEISVYTEVDADRVAVYVRDRGTGFDRAGVAADRRGLAESIEARMHRAGGSATIVSSPGEGTEVELTMPRRAET